MNELLERLSRDIQRSMDDRELIVLKIAVLRKLVDFFLLVLLVLLVAMAMEK